MKKCDVAIIGGGPAGLAAAVAARREGAGRVVIIERDDRLGGILGQCIHNGFGLHTFKEELTGPEYAARYVEQAHESGAEAMLQTMALDITPERKITCVSKRDGLTELSAGAIVLAMGCRERSRGALNIPGYRPAGIFSAGTAQRLVNIEGRMVGRRVVILGSGDIGLIMARRMTLEGAKVLAVAELLPFSGGLKRNIVQCLDDFGIPLMLSHTVVDIEGRERVSAVTIAQVGDDRAPIPGTEVRYECDTLLLSCGLIPENELSRAMGVEIDRTTNGPVVNERLETSIPGVFAAGNVLHVHDLVDFVSEEAASAGRHAALYASGKAEPRERDVRITFSGGPRYTVPSSIDPATADGDITIRYRVGDVMKSRRVSVVIDGREVASRRRPIMAPGEMEEIKITRAMLDDHPGLSEIHIKVEEA